MLVAITTVQPGCAGTDVAAQPLYLIYFIPHETHQSLFHYVGLYRR